MVYANSTIRNWLWRVPYNGNQFQLWTSTNNYIYEENDILKFTGSFSIGDNVNVSTLTVTTQLNSLGKTGIGTTATDALLTIQSPTATEIDIRNNSNNIGSTNTIRFVHGTLGEEIIAKIQSYVATASDSNLRFFTMNSTILNSTACLTLSGDNYVGIGTDEPLHPLHVTAGGIKPLALTSLYPLHVISANHNGGNTPAASEITMVLARDGVAGQSQSNAFATKLSRYEDVSTNARTQVDFSLNHINATDEASLIDVMTLRSDGNVGIQNSAPSHLLVIGNDSITGKKSISLEGDTAGTESLLYFELLRRGSYRSYISATNYGLGLGTSGPGLTTDNFVNNNSEIFIRHTSGNVGIHTSTPTATLDVAGNIKGYQIEASTGIFDKIFVSSIVATSPIYIDTGGDRVVLSSSATVIQFGADPADIEKALRIFNNGISSNLQTRKAGKWSDLVPSNWEIINVLTDYKIEGGKIIIENGKDYFQNYVIQSPYSITCATGTRANITGIASYSGITGPANFVYVGGGTLFDIPDFTDVVLSYEYMVFADGAGSAKIWDIAVPLGNSQQGLMSVDWCVFSGFADFGQIQNTSAFIDLVQFQGCAGGVIFSSMTNVIFNANIIQPQPGAYAQFTFNGQNPFGSIRVPGNQYSAPVGGWLFDIDTHTIVGGANMVGSSFSVEYATQLFKPGSMTQGSGGEDVVGGGYIRWNWSGNTAVPDSTTKIQAIVLDQLANIVNPTISTVMRITTNTWVTDGERVKVEDDKIIYFGSETSNIDVEARVNISPSIASSKDFQVSIYKVSDSTTCFFFGSTDDVIVDTHTTLGRSIADSYTTGDPVQILFRNIGTSLPPLSEDIFYWVTNLQVPQGNSVTFQVAYTSGGGGIDFAGIEGTQESILSAAREGVPGVINTSKAIDISSKATFEVKTGDEISIAVQNDSDATTDMQVKNIALFISK